MKKIVLFINYLWQHQKLVLVAAIFCVFLLLALLTGHKTVVEKVTEGAGLIEATQLIFTIFIGIALFESQRQDKLNKRLTVRFMYENKPFLVCERAYLAGESDIRQWAQSIGSQMVEGYFLHFEPYIEQKSERPIVNGIQYQHFIATFTLRDLNKLPESISKRNIDNQYLLWRCNWENTTTEIKEWRTVGDYPKG